MSSESSASSSVIGADAPSPSSTEAEAGRNILLLGATSSIARAVAERLARDGSRLILAARLIDEAERTASDLRIRYGVAAIALPFEAGDFDAHPAFFDRCCKAFPGGLDGVVICYGSMPPQESAERDWSAAIESIHVNYASPASMLNLAANYFEPRRQGFILAITSVAGDRGRQSNYIYGSAKGALAIYLQGLRNRLTKAGVAVITVKPGFVDTSMTWGLLKPNSPLVASPARVADDIVRAIRKRKAVVYTPWFWRGIMGIIKLIPEPIFRRMKL